MAITNNYPFDTPANYTIVEPAKAEIAGSSAKLKQVDDAGHTYIQTFDNDTGFIFDPNSPRLAEVTGGKLQQIDQRNNAILGANFDTNQNANWAEGSTTGLLVGGATISGGLLDLKGNTNKYLRYSSNNNVGINQGAIKIKFKSNYSGYPPTTYWFWADSHSGNANGMGLSHNSGTGKLEIKIWNGSSVLFMAQNFNTWSPSIGQTYEIELNYSLSLGGSAVRLFINGIQKDSTKTIAGERNNHTYFYLGTNHTHATDQNAEYNDVLLYDTVQHTSNYTPGYTVADTIYLASMVEIAENEADGINMHSLQGVTATENGIPRYTVQVGRSGNYMYWNGATWAISDGTYAQANDIATFNTNITTLDVNNEKYYQIKINFSASNTITDIDLLTTTYTAHTYPIDKPTVEIGTVWVIKELISFVESSTLPGSDNIKYILRKGDNWYYYDGANWVASNESYAQSNTVSEIQNNITTFTTVRVNFGVRFFLHSADGTSTPENNNLAITYDSEGDLPDTINKCLVWDYHRDGEGNPSTEPFIVNIAKDRVRYKTNTTIRKNRMTVTPNAYAYWEIELIETENMNGTQYYTFDFGNGQKESKQIPNVAKINYGDL